VCGLNLLEGALDGCSSLTQGVRQAVGYYLVELCRADGTGAHNSQLFVDGNGLSPEEITQQLKALEQKSATSNGAGSLSSLEEVRDSALSCLKALLSSNLDIFPTQQSQSKSNGDLLKGALSVLSESMELRMDLAMKGVRYRCDVDAMYMDAADRVMNAGDGYVQDDIVDATMEENLSQLPRAKRSMCFTLLEGALDGLNEDVIRGKGLSSELVFPAPVRKTMVKFASFAASCIQGETDPRCLLQLLRLLNKVQRFICPLIAVGATSSAGAQVMDINNNLIQFPFTELFDAVAPYYPVHFTPPKNDPYKITQDALRKALMAVLCEEGVPTTAVSSTSMIEDGDENMIIHAARMFMERLDPMRSSEYQPPSSGVDSEEEDKAEAVRDLSELLLPSKRIDQSNVSDSPKYSPNLTRVSRTLLSELSSTLTRVHEEAVSHHTNGKWKFLASSIRQFSSSLAYSLELHSVSIGSKVSSGWTSFVVNTINHLAPSLETSPQGMHGRASTAYLASLATGGGIVTLKKVLQACIPRLLSVLSKFDNDNTNREQTIAAIRGVAALVASVRVAMEFWGKDNHGVRMHPHPLASYASNIVERVSVIFDTGVNCHDEELLCAVIATIESLLTLADLTLLNDNNVDLLVKMLTLIAEVVLSEDDSVASKSNNEWRRECARAMGVFIATGLEDASDKSPAETPSKLSVLADELCSRAIISATTTLQLQNSFSVSQTYRSDWIALATACSNGTEHVISKILAVVLTKAVSALQSPDPDYSPFMVFSFISQNGGPDVAKAFHSLTSPSITYLDIVNELCKSPGDGKGLLSRGISQLKLPWQNEEENKELDIQIKRAYSVLPHLMPAFESPSAALSFGGIVELLDQSLPPVSKWDENKLCVVSSLAAATLTNSEDIKGLLKDVPSKVLKTLIRQLSEFVIGSQHEKQSRASAATCLFLIVVHADLDEDSSAILQATLDEIYTTLVESLKTLQSDARNPLVLSRIEEIFNFMGHWGSIAACKGGSLSSIADEIATFFVEMACTGSSSFPLNNYTIEFPKSSTDENENQSITDNHFDSSILPALSFGNMLSVNAGSPFWRQRIIFKIIPVVMKVVKQEAQSHNPPPSGALAVCSILSCFPSSLLNEENSKQITPMLIAGLVHLSKHVDEMTQTESLSSNVLDVLGLTLVGFVKILSEEHLSNGLGRFIGVIISSLLRLSTREICSESYYPKQLFALQCLENVARAPVSRNTKLRERDQVVAELSTVVDHPSVIIRQAVVHVRNMWYTL